jgi:hypothetical protein
MTHAILILSLLLPGGQMETPRAWGKSDTFQIKSESVVYCAATDSYEFEIKFTEAPGFETIEPPYRLHHQLQYFVWYDDSPFVYMGFPVMVWSIGNVYGSGIEVRDVVPGSACGWCDVLGVVDYTTNNKTVRFSIPADIIGDHDGHISYKVQTHAYGGNTVGRFNHSTISKNCGHSIRAAPAQATTWGMVKSTYR